MTSDVENMPTVVLVDFDGTLMDTAPDLVALTLDTLAIWGLRPAPDAVERLLGLPTAERLRRHGVPEDQLERAAARFLDLHAACQYYRSRPMQGAAAWLAGTSHLAKWIVSASPRSAVVAGLRYHRLAAGFERVLAAPPAAGLDKVAALLPHRPRLTAARGWLLGDQIGDLDAASSVQARFVLVRNPRNGALEPLADRVIANFEDLLSLPLEAEWTPSQ
jgi:phosphoglycolate phosphatase-like HAD superfamily hydrolase